jgi:tetratricopeptide (TPR) repeat protein
MAAGDDRRTGHWAVAGKHHLHGDADGPTGPTGGLARGIPTDDVAFTRGKIAPMRDDFSAGRDAGDTGGHTGGDDYDDLDDLDAIPQRSGVGRWIVVASLLLIAGAGVALYLLVFRAPNKGAGDTGDTPVAEVKGDAGAAVPAALDAATAEPEQDPLTAAQAALAGDVAAAIEAADAPLAEMAKADGGDVDIALLVTRARIQTALAQKRVDAASAVAADDKAAAKALQREADKFVIKALELGQKARKLGGDDVGALVVMADVSRLQRKRTRDVDRYLTPALKQDKENREARLVRAMLLARDGKADRARAAFEALANEDGAADDVRPVYRLALLSFAAKDMDAARRYANQVVAAQAEHEGAKALLARIDEVTRVSTADPLPPEVGDDDDDGGSSGPVGVDAYDGLLSRADKKAETGNCREAMKLYDRALDANPSGVAALVGLGICHVDQREFASAHSKFRAALGISPRYQDALWGIAEAYQQQGLKPQAVNAFKKFLEEHPNSRRAEAARRRIELLGGSTGGSSDGDDDSGGAGGGTGTTGGGTTGGGTTGGGTTGGGTTGGGTGDGAGGGDTGGDTGGGTGGGGTGGGTTGGDTGGGGGSGGTGDPPPTPDPDSAAESG